MTLFIRQFFACYIPYSASLGKNIILGYGGLGVVIHGRAVIGNDCHIDQNVTIGGTSKKYEVPVLGDNVYVGAGAKILGPITIGDNVVIGANAVVVNDIPSNSLAVGVPAKIIKSGIKKSDYV
jgi:serine O-acetyltransferase